MTRRSTLELMRSRPYRAWLLGLLLVTAMFAFIDRQIISALAQPMKRDLGLSDAELGLLGGLAFAVLNTAIGLPIARLAERFNRVVIYAAGVLLWSVATVSCGLTANFLQLLLARVGVGVGEAGQSAVSSLMADYYPADRRTSSAAVLMLSVPLGALLGSAGGGWIAQHADWRLAFAAAGAPGFVLAALLILTIREPIRGHHDAPGLFGEGVPPFSAVLRRMVERPSFLHVTIGSTLASAGGFGINVFMAPYFFRRFGLDFAESGLIAGLISAIPGVISMYGGGLLTSRLGRRDPRWYAWTPGLGALLAAPLYVASFLVGGWVAATALLMGTGVFQYVYLPASVGVQANTMEPRMRATAAALVNIMTNLVGSGAGPLVVGALSDRFTRAAFAGNYRLVCAGARAAEAATAGTCGRASATGLEWAFIVTALVYLWAALHFHLAARTLKRDMA